MEQQWLIQYYSIHIRLKITLICITLTLKSMKSMLALLHNKNKGMSIYVDIRSWLNECILPSTARTAAISQAAKIKVDKVLNCMFTCKVDKSSWSQNCRSLAFIIFKDLHYARDPCENSETIHFDINMGCHMARVDIVWQVYRKTFNIYLGDNHLTRGNGSWWHKGDVDLTWLGSHGSCVTYHSNRDVNISLLEYL